MANIGSNTLYSQMLNDLSTTTRSINTTPFRIQTNLKTF